MNKTSSRFQQVRSILGNPHCEGEGYAIYCLDCLQAMPLLPPALFDLTVTSPPYNIGKEYERPLSTGEYIAWSERWFAEVYRLTTDHGAFWLNLGYVALPERARAIPLPYLLWQKCPFFLIQE